MTPLVESESEPMHSTTRLRDKLLTTFHVMLVLGGFLVFFAAYWLGILFNSVYVLLLALVLGMGFSRAFGSCWETLELRFIQRPLDRAFRKYLLQCLNLWLFLIVAGISVQIAVVPAQFAPEKYRALQMITWGAVIIVMLIALIPHKKVRLSINSFFAIGWLFLGMQLIRILLPVGMSEAVVLTSPFAGESYIFNGGRSVLINHHYMLVSQRYALDIIKTKDGLEVDGDKSQLESYPAWGQTLYAPADGKVVSVVNDRPDVAIGTRDSHQIVGNHIVLDIGNGRFVLMAHLKEGSVRVSPGEKVKSGQALAACGNSGNTTAPHLHLQVQSHADFNKKDLRTFPILFSDVTRVRGGRHEHLHEADVRRNDRLVAREAEGGDTEKKASNRSVSED